MSSGAPGVAVVSPTPSSGATTPREGRLLEHTEALAKYCCSFAESEFDDKKMRFVLVSDHLKIVKCFQFTGVSYRLNLKGKDECHVSYGAYRETPELYIILMPCAAPKTSTMITQIR